MSNIVGSDNFSDRWQILNSHEIEGEGRQWALQEMMNDVVCWGVMKVKADTFTIIRTSSGRYAIEKLAPLHDDDEMFLVTFIYDLDRVELPEGCFQEFYATKEELRPLGVRLRSLGSLQTDYESIYNGKYYGDLSEID